MVRQHEEACRLQVQLLGRLLADADARPAAAGAELLRLGQVVDDLAAFEVLGQGGAAVRVALARSARSVGAVRACARRSRAAAEAVLQGRVEFATQRRRSRPRSRANSASSCANHAPATCGTSSGSGIGGESGGIHAR